MFPYRVHLYRSIPIFFSFFLSRQNSTRARRDVCAARAERLIYEFHLRTSVSFGTQGYGKTRNTSEGNNSFLQLRGSEHGERVIPVSP